MTHGLPSVVAAAYAAMPEAARTTLTAVRERLFALAAEAAVGPLTETLKWGEPSYLTMATGAGTTVRLGLARGRAAVLVHCQTSLVADLQRDFAGRVETAGNRAVFVDRSMDPAILDHVLLRALTYHRTKAGARA